LRGVVRALADATPAPEPDLVRGLRLSHPAAGYGTLDVVGWNRRNARPPSMAT